MLKKSLAFLILLGPVIRNGLQQGQESLTPIQTFVPEDIPTSQPDQENIIGIIEDAVQGITTELDYHPAAHNQLFVKLADIARNHGLTKEQYLMLRNNIVARTRLTIPGVAMSVAFAALNDDFQSVSLNGRNLWDEVGYGDPKKVHGQLLLKAFSKLDKIFGVESLTKLSDALNSSYLTDGLRNYIDVKQGSFSADYSSFAGFMLAHEHLADAWLDGLKGLFEVYKDSFDPKEYQETMSFFLAHRDEEVEGGNVEEMHGIMAREAAARSCDGNLTNVEQVKAGAIAFADAQARLWDSMVTSLGELRGSSEPIKAKQNANVVDKHIEGEKKSETRESKPVTSVKLKGGSASRLQDAGETVGRVAKPASGGRG